VTHPDDPVLLECVLEAIASEAIPLDDEHDLAALVVALAELVKRLEASRRRRSIPGLFPIGASGVTPAAGTAVVRKSGTGRE
jgi:hypothetical protein